MLQNSVSMPIGRTNLNIAVISRKAKVPKVGPKILYKRSYKMFCTDSCVEDRKSAKKSAAFDITEP